MTEGDRDRDQCAGARRLRWRLPLATTLALLVAAPAATAVMPGRYKGKTSQERSVSIRVTSPTRMDLKLFYKGRCDNGRRFTGSVSVVDIRVSSRGRFPTIVRGRGTIVGIGSGAFRHRLVGQVRRNIAEGKFRSTFRSRGIVCRSGGVPFKARRR